MPAKALFKDQKKAKKVLLGKEKEAYPQVSNNHK